MLCDVDENGYSFGYCQGKAIPAWLAVVRGKAQPLVQLSSDLDICKWLQGLPKMGQVEIVPSVLYSVVSKDAHTTSYTASSFAIPFGQQ